MISQVEDELATNCALGFLAMYQHVIFESAFVIIFKIAKFTFERTKLQMIFFKMIPYKVFGGE